VPSEVPPQERPQFCEQQFIPPVQDRQFHYETLPIILVAMSPVAISLGWLLGASLVGAEWHAGTMATLLTWEPRRLRVLAAKLVAAGALAFTLAVGLQLLLGAALLPAGLLRGTTQGIDSSWMRSLSGVGLRVAGVSVLGAMMGFRSPPSAATPPRRWGSPSATSPSSRASSGACAPAGSTGCWATTSWW